MKLKTSKALSLKTPALALALLLAPALSALAQSQTEHLELVFRENGLVTETLEVDAEVDTDENGTPSVTYRKPESPSNRIPRFKIELDGGLTQITKNDVRIPNPGGTLFSLASTAAVPAFRAYFAWAINQNHSIRILYAPFSAQQTISPQTNIVFQGITYLAGQPVDAYYRFNSYRVGYIYHFDRIGNTIVRIGLTGKIRDARIGLGPNAATTGNGYNDLGFVPLIHFGVQYRFLRQRAFADFESESLVFPGAPGRAIEASLQAGRKIAPGLSISGGYRILEGGADVNIYNFALLQSVFTRITYQF
jgi:hypothetical protein